MSDDLKKVATGRPLANLSKQDSAMDNYNSRLTAWHARQGRKLGNGNLSEGIRRALEYLTEELAAAEREGRIPKERRAEERRKKARYGFAPK